MFFSKFIALLAVSYLTIAAPLPGPLNEQSQPIERSLPSIPPSLPNPNSWIFDRSLLGSIQGQAKKPSNEFFEQIHKQLLNAWKAQVEVKRYWEVVDEIKASKADAINPDLGVRTMDGWAREDKYQWRTNCEWLVGVSKRLTAVYKLPVPALSIFPDATPRYCMIKL